MELEVVQTSSKKLEKFVIRKLDPPAWANSAVVLGLSAVTERKIGTTKIKGFDWTNVEDSWSLRPDLEYHFDGSTSGTLKFNLSF